MTEKLKKIGRSAAIAGAGAALAYLLAAIQSGGLDLGIYGPLAAAALAWLVNTLREMAKADA